MRLLLSIAILITCCSASVHILRCGLGTCFTCDSARGFAPYLLPVRFTLVLAVALPRNFAARFDCKLAQSGEQHLRRSAACLPRCETSNSLLQSGFVQVFVMACSPLWLKRH